MVTVAEPDILNLVRDRLVERFQPLQIIMFGSRARGTARPDSDIDLLVVVSSAPDKRVLAVEMRRALRDLPVGKDILVTTPEEIEHRGQAIGSALKSALQEGRVIFARQ